MDKNKLVSEAKKSLYAIRMYAGPLDISKITDKWPDVIDSVLAEDDEKFREDISHIICLPLVYIAEALTERLRMFANDTRYDNLERIVNNYKLHPLETKTLLVEFCNMKVDELKRHGVEVPKI